MQRYIYATITTAAAAAAAAIKVLPYNATKWHTKKNQDGS